MSENDLIAEYVKEHYPELLGTTDFALYKFSKAVLEVRDKIIEAVKKVDFCKLSKAAHEVAENPEVKKLQGRMDKE